MVWSGIKNSFFWQYYRKIKLLYCEKHPMKIMDKFFYRKFGRKINWENPQDLNEKINWLRLHIDLEDWACLADKYLVRRYVKKKGLDDCLVNLYGHWTTAEGVLDDFDSLPDEFVLKSNNGNKRVILVTKENGGKNAVDKEKLYITLRQWLNDEKTGIEFGELHYQYIKNCIIAEELLKDDGVKEFSRSLVDYKIWCFNGIPYGCLVVYDREIGTEYHCLDFYDLLWNERSEVLSDKSPRHQIPKPQNWEKMIEIARTLSQGHPQMRVDLYNINGHIYFGELTMSSANALMDYFSDEALVDMGKQIRLDYSLPWNEFAERKYRNR